MDRLVDLILNAPQYFYPRFHVEIVNDGEIVFGRGVRGRFVADDGPTDDALDKDTMCDGSSARNLARTSIYRVLGARPRQVRRDSRDAAAQWL